MSRRGLLVGTAAVAAVLVAGAGGLDLEVDRHPGIRRLLGGCGITPSVPSSSYRIVTGTANAPAMRAPESWVVALPADHVAGDPLPVVLALPGLDGVAGGMLTGVGLPGWATQAGIRMAFASSDGAGGNYYHPRANGTNDFEWLTEEFLPMVEQRFGVGGSRRLRGVFGWSMGGFGALLIGQKRPDLVSAVVASSPAVFPSYQAAITGHPDTFDSLADWERWGFWDQAETMHAVAARLDCGNADPLAATTRALLTRIPGAVGHVGDGCHDVGFWRRNAGSQLRFLRDHLAA